MDRIDLKTFSEIHKALASDSIQIGITNDKFYFRFGYWQQADDKSLKIINDLLPNHLCLQLELVDEDDDCGELWNYKVVRKNC